MVRSVMPHKFNLKNLNARNLINSEFLSHLWQDTNIKVDNSQIGRNKHMTNMRIELEEWFVIEAHVEIFDLAIDDVLDVSDILSTPTKYSKGFVVERIPDYTNLDDISTLRNILLFNETTMDMISVCVVKDNLLYRTSVFLIVPLLEQF